MKTILAAVLFAVSTKLLQLEVIVGGAIVVTLTTSLLVTRIIDNQAIQGLAIVLIGIGMVVVASALNSKPSTNNCIDVELADVSIN